MGTIQPIYKRRKPDRSTYNPANIGSDINNIDLNSMHLEPYDAVDIVAKAQQLFDARRASAIKADVAAIDLNGYPIAQLLEVKTYGDFAPPVIIPIARSLSAIAYPDFFPGANDLNYRLMVSGAILAANPGWCGSVGPGVHGTVDMITLEDPPEGNYDMSQMHLLQLAYAYFNELDPFAREHLINILLATGRINRIDENDIVTSGGAPTDYSRVGFVSPAGFHFRIGETENHILMIHTVRYLTNQLLYQRDHDIWHDNRRNDREDISSCKDLMLFLLQNILKDDFSEYNAKNYQNETRHALLNLYNYAYDDDVRLAARMVLDYISAHLAVSSNDLRRMVPFRRRNESKNVTRSDQGFMETGLVETADGADPMAQHFALIAGNTRIYGQETIFHPAWRISTAGANGNDAVMDALSDYRLPPSVHDLFLNDLHRRFFQRIHHTPLGNEEETGRNIDNYEIYASAPSYLISAGGAFATWAIDPGPVSLSAKLRRKNDQQLGVAVPSSFIPTTRILPGVVPLLNCGDPYTAKDIIQFGAFSDVDGVFNYGVAPDFACGHQAYLPLWCTLAMAQNHDQHPEEDYPGFSFVDRGSAGNGPGFFLAFFRQENVTVMEAFDTWQHPHLSFEIFKRTVFILNNDFMHRGIFNGVPNQYKTINGNLIHFVVWDGSDPNNTRYGAEVLSIDYSGSEPMDNAGDAGNVKGPFVNGGVLNLNANGTPGVVEITNLFLNTKLTLDMSDALHPVRISENGEVERAGFNFEVWVDFDWNGPMEGDFFRPFNTIAAAVAAVADGGVIKVMPGTTKERPHIQKGKRFKIVAPIGGVVIGAR